MCLPTSVGGGDGRSCTENGVEESLGLPAGDRDVKPHDVAAVEAVVRALDSSAADMFGAEAALRTLARQLLPCLCSSPRHAEANRSVSHDYIVRLCRPDLPNALVESFARLSFEAQKDAMRLFVAVLRLAPDGSPCREELHEHLASEPGVLRQLLRGAGEAHTATPCQCMLRACLQHLDLAPALLSQRGGEELISLAREPFCEVAFEAFETLRMLLLRPECSPAAAAYLAAPARAEGFFALFHRLFGDELGGDCGVYAAKRQALKLLGDLLLKPEMSEVMVDYVCSERNLKVIMNAMRDPSRTIQLGAFHVFKIFVANPYKSERVAKILSRNRDRLVKLLSTFLEDATSDESLYADLIAVIEGLKAMAPTSPTASNM